MPEPVRWAMQPHTQAKHRVLRSYLDGWIPIMGHQALKVRARTGEEPRLLVVDGFAGPGRYTGGEPGSPLIMLDALTTHTALLHLGDVAFHYLFIEQDGRRVDALREELGQLDLPPNVHVHPEEGHFEDSFGSLVDDITGRGRALIPTFAFIDPFGYSDAPMSLTGRFLDFPRSEALFFLPLSHLARFVSRDGQEAAYSALFDSDRWHEAIALSGESRRSFLLKLFEEQLRSQGQVNHVTSFQLRTLDGNDYRLVYATGHPKGLEVMKRAMWSVDPVGGTSYAARTDTGQEVLFTPTVDTAPLLAELRATFGTRWFTPGEAVEVTNRTPFIASSHLKRKTLAVAERDGVLEVDRPPGYTQFTDGVRMRFLE